MTDQHIYPLRYTIEYGDFLIENASEDQGLTHSLVLISCIEQPDGSYSQTWHSFDGNKKQQMSHDDVFKAWILMAASLAEKDDLSSNKRSFVNTVWETWRQAVLGAKKSQ